MYNDCRAPSLARFRRRRSTNPVGGTVIGVAELQDGEISAGPSDELKTHGKPSRAAKASRNADYRQASHRGRYDYLHPSVVRVHWIAGDVVGQALLISNGNNCALGSARKS